MEKQVTRASLMQMLSEISDEALEYVQLPIFCAYYWTDGRDGDMLSEEDIRRYFLIGAAAHEPLEVVEDMDGARKGHYRLMELRKRFLG